MLWMEVCRHGQSGPGSNEKEKGRRNDGNFTSKLNRPSLGGKFTIPFRIGGEVQKYATEPGIQRRECREGPRPIFTAKRGRMGLAFGGDFGRDERKGKRKIKGYIYTSTPWEERL